MIHRVIYGSLERFIGILIEHYAGAFPLWLSPVQINIIPVNNEYHLSYSQELQTKLLNEGFRVELDDRNEKLSYKMRESQIKKISYTIVIGDEEVSNQTLNYRQYGDSDQQKISQDKFVDKLKEEIKKK